MKRKLLIGLLLTSSIAFGNNEITEDVAGIIGSGIGGTIGGTIGTFVNGLNPAQGASVGASMGGLAGKYGVRKLDKTIGNSIDRHFDKKDQEFSNKTGITLEYPNGKTISPSKDKK